MSTSRPHLGRQSPQHRPHPHNRHGRPGWPFRRRPPSPNSRQPPPSARTQRLNAPPVLPSCVLNAAGAGASPASNPGRSRSAGCATTAAFFPPTPSWITPPAFAVSRRFFTTAPSRMESPALGIPADVGPIVDAPDGDVWVPSPSSYPVFGSTGRYGDVNTSWKSATRGIRGRGVAVVHRLPPPKKDCLIRARTFNKTVYYGRTTRFIGDSSRLPKCVPI